tara:strand:- start:228 stop:548 length:321 start_codon:yes stop_codon:yes gene_type:complete
MEYGLHHIIATGATITTLIPIHGSGGSIKSIRLTNASAAVVNVDLYLEDSTAVDSGRSHIVTTDIPAKTTLLLNEGVSFDNSVLGLSVKTTGASLAAATPFSVIIK